MRNRARLAGLLALAPWAASAQPADDVPIADVIIAAPAALVGTGIARDRVPAQTSVLDSHDLAREGAPDALRSLANQVGGVSLDSASGNPYQPTLLYHGFAASPLQGTAQGLAVYLGGVRFNQAFGDTVNWDLIPDLAIERINVEGSNPVFGLNALGGSLNVQLKTGFGYQGGEAVLSGGAFGQIQAQAQYGARSADGRQAAYVAGTALHGDGWRDLQSSDIYNIYGDAGWRGEAAEAHVSLTAANTILNGPGTAPVELLAADPRAQFTAPNVVANKFVQAGLSGTYDVTETLSVQALAYAANFEQRVVNGNSSSAGACPDGGGLLCDGAGHALTTRGGGLVRDFLHGGPYSELDAQTTTTTGYGAALQATSGGTAFGLANHIVGGLGFDGAQTGFSATALLGGLTPLDRVFVGPGVVLDAPGVNAPVRLGVRDAYYGAFVTDTLSLTRALAVTLSGRFNTAEIDLADGGGGRLTGQHSYSRFNPAAGLTYKLASWLTVYGGYAEANRAPTPSELSCAGPNDACSLANFFTGDPNLKQVVARTVELGVRGSAAAIGDLTLSYAVGLFRTVLSDDIGFINSATQGRAYFATTGQTRRQGFDAGLQAKTGRLLAYVDYGLTDATFQNGFTQGGGSNPAQDVHGDLAVRRGAHLPGIAEHQVKFGVQVDVSAQWVVGASGVIASGAYLFGDDANRTQRLPGYAVLNLNTRYQLTPHVQLFALGQNVTDRRYYTYGTFAPTGTVALAQAPGATNPRSYSVAAPIGGFGGVRVTF